MLAQVRHYVDVAVRARDLGCRVPAGIALLPGNFPTATNANEFRYHAATPYIRSAWRGAGLIDEGPAAAGGDMTQLPQMGIVSRADASGGIVPPARQAETDGNGAKVALAVFFGAGIIGGPDPNLTVALSLVSRVLALDPRCASPREVRFDAVVERPGGCGYTCIEYHGDAFELVDLVREVRRIWAGSEPGENPPALELQQREE